MRVDWHTHVDEVPARGWSAPAAAVVAAMDAAGVERALCTSYRDAPCGPPDPVDLLCRAVTAYPDRLRALVRVNPVHPGALDLVTDALDRPEIVGVKLHPVSSLAHPADPAVAAVLRVAGQRGAPVLAHSGDHPYAEPWALALAAAAAPDTTVVLGHMGGYTHVDDAIAVAEEHPNVLLETSAMPWPGRVAEAVERLGAERVLFGSDTPAGDLLLELDKITLADLRPEATDRVLGGNAWTLLEGRW